jgi:hypothetical protein
LYFAPLVPLLHCILCKVQMLSTTLIEDAIGLEDARDCFIGASNAYILFELGICVFKVLARML